ncbi:MAG: 3-deoxy-7-phosphoheptulonate synthase [Planctomycetaceae bacterium]
MSATSPQIHDVNSRENIPLTSPRDLKAEIPLPEDTARFVYDSREAVKAILRGEDRRIFAVVGPCSIHHPDIATEYAEKLARVARDVNDRIMVIMRVYFEKPRTTVGWKGLINDPGLNDTFDMARGLKLARQVLLNVNRSGLPAATEMLEPITPQYIADLITLASIGARTTESPTHRQMASGLSMPVGFKNSTEGSLEVATNAMKAAQAEHCFLGIDNDGKTCIVNTKGNDMSHLILRGGKESPNYDAVSLAEASALLKKDNLLPRLVVDCSHANSRKDYRNQPLVWNDVLQQRIRGNDTIVGLMLESNLKAGNQPLTSDLSQLEWGVSITDGCISFEQTEDLLRSAHEALEGHA